MASHEHIIGIDLGTTNSVVAIIEAGSPQIISNSEGQAKTPSVVAFLENGDVVAGEIARRQAATLPGRVISSAKRLLGRYKQELDEEGEVYPFEIGEDKDGRATIVVGGKAYGPEQISALILEKLKAAAEDHLGEPVKKAIITVPAYFDDVQRHATLEASRAAGLEVLRLLNEPTAAAMAYGLDKDTTETVAIYDFGGGTFDFSLLEVDNKTFEVLTTTGNSRLGGDDLDMALVDSVAEKFLADHGIDLRTDNMMLRRLKDDVERVKCELSSAETAVLSLPFIAYKDGAPLHLEQRVTREQLEELIEPFVNETINCCRSAMKDSRIRKNQITKVILVGGSTRIPMVQEAVEDFFGVPPFRGVNPDEVVAIGAAMQGAVLAGSLEEVVLLEVTPHTLSIETRGNKRSVLIEKNATIPIRVHKTFTTTEENQSFVNIHLLQGEEERASDNRSLGKFTLSGIPEAAKGAPRIRVEVFVNADGVVEVSASESHSGSEQKLTTSLSYLDAAERRARQGLGKGAAKRRRRGSSSSSESRKRILEGAPARAASNGASAAPAEAASAAGAPELGASFAEVDESASRAERRRRLADTGAQRPAAPAASVAPTVVAAPQAVPEPARAAEAPQAAPPAKAPAPEPAAIPAAASANADNLKAAVALAEAPRPAGAPEPRESAPPAQTGRPVPMPRAKDIPPALAEVFGMLAKDGSDEAAQTVYQRDRKEFLAFCREREEDEATQNLRVKFLILSKLPEEANDALLECRRKWAGSLQDHFSLYGLLCRNYPNYLAARKERAQVAWQVGDLKLAMADLEFLARRDDADTKVFDELARVYEQILNAGADSTLQFKLVKMYLRKGELDQAISLLQQLVQIDAFRERANKVLGLCFWQKGLRYLALQKFKTLPVDDEVKDILFRLGAEMEKNDEILHAKYAFERIYEADIGFRDTAERLKKLSYRLDIMKDDRLLAGRPAGAPAEHTRRLDLLGDRFELLEEINRGSMGIVFRAHDRLLDEVVAVKILNDFLCADPEAVNRFKREAKAARKLTHEHIVRIHDFLDLDSKKIISMEYIEGEDMKRILSRHTTFSEDMILNYLRQICSALAYAHTLGIVHRDIKPANIMINERNQVKVTDFGIAKVLDAAATRNNTMIMGTPLYMAPEQIRGAKIDQRVDIYALGIMLYEFVTGSPPFSEGSIEYQHLHAQVPVITCGATAELRRIVMKCVEKDPKERYQRIEELQADLAQL